MADEHATNGNGHARTAALAYLRAGLSIIPIKTDGSKQPAWDLLPKEPDPNRADRLKAVWKPFTSRLPTEDEVAHWFRGRKPPGIGVISGAVSGNLEIIDFDYEAETIFPEFCKMVEAKRPSLIACLSIGKSPKPGFHIRYRCHEVTIPGNQDLAKREDNEVLIELRGEINYTISPGSPAECHPSGRLYEHLSGPRLSQVPTISAADRDVLIRCARYFDRSPKTESVSHKPASNRVGDDFNTGGWSWDQILSGWTHLGGHYWRRPGKDTGGCSATTSCKSKDGGHELFHVFSGNAHPFERDKSYSKFSAYAILHHGADFSGAARELGRQGFGEQMKVGARQTKDIAHDLPDVHLTDVGNGRRLVDRHGRDIHYCHPWKQWLVWDGRRWAEDQTAEVVRRVKDTQSGLYKWAAQKIIELGDVGDDEDRKKQLAKLNRVLNHCLRWEDARCIDRCLKSASSEPSVPILPDALDAHHFLFNALNGTIDLRSGKLREHQRGDLLTKLAPVEYNSAAQCPLWKKCLACWFSNNTDLIAYLQRVAGYCLTGSVDEQCLWFFYGPGQNGKTTCLGTWQAMMGDYAIQTVSELLMQKNNESHPTERADLFRVRLAVTIETDEGKRMAEALMKKLTGGDPIRARKMRKDHFQFLPTHKLILAANHKPIIRGSDFAVWRRIKLIHFTVTIPEESKDRGLSDKLKIELPGILAWAVRGCLEWQKNGLGEPEEVRQATDSYRAEQDLLAAFIIECCFVNDVASTQASVFYDRYIEWSGDKWTTKMRLTAMMLDRGFPSEKGTGGRMFYKGIGLP
jgi:P4 family phage/plasmid primase-like protien